MLQRLLNIFNFWKNDFLDEKKDREAYSNALTYIFRNVVALSRKSKADYVYSTPFGNVSYNDKYAVLIRRGLIRHPVKLYKIPFLKREDCVIHKDHPNFFFALEEIYRSARNYGLHNYGLYKHNKTFLPDLQKTFYITDYGLVEINVADSFGINTIVSLKSEDSLASFDIIGSENV